MISCILLSAGYSSRFGAPKALATLGKITVIEHLLQMLLHSRIDDIFVILGAQKNQIEPYILKHKNIRIVYNKDYNLGQTSSFKAGLAQRDGDEGAVFLLPVDYPLVTTKTIDTLIAHYGETKSLITIPTYRGRNGHPPLFSSVFCREVQSLPDNEGIHQAIHRHAADVALIPVPDSGVTKTFNTPEEFREIESFFTSRQ